MTLTFYRGTKDYNDAFYKAKSLVDDLASEILYVQESPMAVVLRHNEFLFTVTKPRINVEIG